MTLIVNCEEHLASAREFAARVGKTESLEESLSYLEHYSGDRCECVLHKDFAPYSFAFTMFFRERTATMYEQKCKECGETWTGETHYTDCYYCEKKGCVECVKVFPRRIKRERWFNGGLIYHGPHDRGGDGGAPTFSVNLTPQDGWEIHT